MMQDYNISEFIIRILIILLLIGINAFFVTAEISLSSIRPSRVDELISNGSRRAKAAKKLISNKESLLSATQFGITLASLALGWVGESTVADMLSPLNLDAIIPGFTFGISALLAFLFITFLHVVLGVIAPNNIALNHSEKSSLWIAKPMEWFITLTNPVVKFFNFTASTSLRVFGFKPATSSQIAHSEDELKVLITQSEAAGIISEQESDILQRAFDLPDTLVREIMTPRIELELVSLNDDFYSILRTVKESGHSRLPVYADSRDNIVGVLYGRDLLTFFSELLDKGINLKKEKPDVRKILHKVDYIPETMPAHKLLSQFQNSKRQIAIVINEFGGVEGLVSLEDVLEVLVGDIQDEYDTETPEIVSMSTGISEVSAQTSLEEFNEYFGTNFESEESVTIGGYLTERIGRIPEIGEVFIMNNSLSFQVIKKDGFRLETLQVTKIQQKIGKSVDEKTSNNQSLVTSVEKAFSDD